MRNTFQIELEFRSVGFEEEKPEHPEKKTSRSKYKNQQQTQPTYDVESGNRTRATLVREASAFTTAPSLAPRKYWNLAVLRQSWLCLNGDEATSHNEERNFPSSFNHFVGANKDIRKAFLEFED